MSLGDQGGLQLKLNAHVSLFDNVEEITHPLVVIKKDEFIWSLCLKLSQLLNPPLSLLHSVSVWICDAANCVDVGLRV